MICTLRHAFEATTTEKEATLKEALNAKVEVMHLKNELRQAQAWVQQDVLTIQALESAKSNFMGMQSQLDRSLVKNEEYQTQLPTLQDQLLIIQVDLDCLWCTPKLLDGLNYKSKVKIAKGYEIGVRSLARNTSGVEGRVGAPRCELRRMTSRSIIDIDLHKLNNKLVNA